jgi:hypothetical protein
MNGLLVFSIHILPSWADMGTTDSSGVRMSILAGLNLH